MSGTPACIAPSVAASRPARSAPPAMCTSGCRPASRATTSASNCLPRANRRSSTGDGGSGSHGRTVSHWARTGHCLAT